MNRYAKRVRERWDDALSRVGWEEFERRIGEYYASQGYRVEHTGTGSGFGRTDGGVDLKLFKDTAYIVVQCKHWNAQQVPHNPVHELIGVMHTQGANGAILVTSGEFTRAALDSAARFPGITLIDGPTVRGMIGPIEEPLLHPPALAPPPSWLGARPRRRTLAGDHRGRDAVLFSVAIAATVASLFAYTQFVRTATLPPTKRAMHAPAPEATSPFAGYASRGPAIAPVSHPDASATAHDSTPRTPEELKAWQRQNAESMRILEKTTPEVAN